MKPSAHIYYFLGIGGIGMSALARYLHRSGAVVLGYDKTATQLTTQLQNEGIAIDFNSSQHAIPALVLADRQSVTIVYTPAVPADMPQLVYFKTHNYKLIKRAELLAQITNLHKTIAIAGTHGKTSITTFTSYLYAKSAQSCTAFLGGISKNFNENVYINSQSEYMVIEADEFDKSFHHLQPYVALISSIDADHLDIYGSYNSVLDSFKTFIKKITQGGSFIYKLGLPLEQELQELQGRNVASYSYSLDKSQADFYASDIRKRGAHYTFTIVTPFGELPELVSYVPGLINVENLVGAVALALCGGVEQQEVAQAVPTLLGVRRRLDIRVNTPQTVYIDDYAHHPAELKACIESVKKLYSGKRITAVFQPHLYSRTRDFYKEFAQSLSLADEVILLDIYPARELPIAGVSSRIIFDAIEHNNKIMLPAHELIHYVQSNMPQVLITMGAGNIDTLVEPLETLLNA